MPESIPTPLVQDCMGAVTAAVWAVLDDDHARCDWVARKIIDRTNDDDFALYCNLTCFAAIAALSIQIDPTDPKAVFTKWITLVMGAVEFSNIVTDDINSLPNDPEGDA